MDSLQKQLSIILLCYNHENFIEKCLESIFAQKTKYKYIVYASDDASPDQSRSILRKYHALHSDKMELVFPNQNRGVGPSFEDCYNRIKTPYYCILEGDDYWCDDHKIESQLDMLESNQDMVGCAHNFNILDNATGSIRKEYEDGSHTQLLTPQVFFQCYFHTSTYIWRKVYPDKLPEYLNHPLYAGDTLHALAHGHKGNVGYIDKAMSVYRIHEKGMWNKMSSEEQLIRNVGVLIYADQCFEGAYKEVISGRFHSLPLFRRLFDCSLNSDLKLKILQNISRSPFKRKLITKIDRLWQTHFS